MAGGSSSEITSSSQADAESSESTVEVNVKTLDSQIHTFRVNKNTQVSLLKEKIASAIGIPIELQRLIFRGKVLKDDHLLSEYHLEDGHTLHLVVRQPVQSQTLPGTSSGESNRNHDNRGNDSTPGAPRNRVGQVSHSVVLGTLNIGDQGEGMVPDLSRIIGAVLNSVGIGNLSTTGGNSNGSSTSVANSTTQPSQGTETGGPRENAGGRSQAGNQGQPGQAFLNLPFQTLHQSIQFPLQGAVAVPPLQMVIPDSLTTLSEFINRMELALSPNGDPTSSSQVNVVEPSQEFPSSNVRGLPTPAALVTVMRQAQQLLSGHAGASLSSIAGRLEREGSTADTVTRGQIQAEAMQVGVAMQHLGALLLELGRTILTLRMGQSPAESVVNAGPAVYISPSGPNPIMVQPSSFQNNSLFGFSPAVLPQTNPGISGPPGLGDVARHINIHIHAGTTVAPGTSSVGARMNAGETTNVEQHSNQAQGSANGTGSADSGPRRVLPVRSVVAAVPARSPAEAASHVLSVFYPHQARSQQAAPSNSASAQGASSSPAVSDGAQRIIGTASQNSQSISLPAVVAQVHAQIRNVDRNIQQESSSGPTVGIADMLHAGEGVQVPSEASAIRGFSFTSSTGDGERNQHFESMANSGPGVTTRAVGSVSRHISEVDGTSGSDRHQPQLSGSQFISDMDAGVRSSTARVPSSSIMGETTNCSTLEAPSSKSEVQPSEKTANEFAFEHASSSSKGQEPSDGGRTVPLGLGSGGLQPKRSKQVKLQGKDGVNATLPVQNQNQQFIARGQQALQSLISGGDSMNIMDAPPLFRQLMDSMPLEGQGADGQRDVAGMMSQVLQSPVMDSLLSGVSEQVGVGSPAGLRGILEQLTQSPSVRNTLNQIAQEVEGQSQDLGNMLSGLGRAQGGIDFSRMFQQLMPVVSQVLGQGSAIPEHSPGVESEPQSSNGNMERKYVQVDGSISQTDLHQAVEQFEGRDPPINVFRVVVENAGHLHGEGNADLIEEICNDETLANEFMEMLQRDIHQRFQSESRSSTDKS